MKKPIIWLHSGRTVSRGHHLLRLGGGIGQMLLLLVGAGVKLLHIELINPMG